MSTGKADASVICNGTCWTGETVAGSPETVTAGVCGKITLIENRPTYCVSLLSVTVTANEKLPAATGVPLITPAFGSMLSPAGSPFADQVYGGTPPLAVRVCE